MATLASIAQTSLCGTATLAATNAATAANNAAQRTPERGPTGPKGDNTKGDKGDAGATGPAGTNYLTLNGNTLQTTPYNFEVVDGVGNSMASFNATSGTTINSTSTEINSTTTIVLKSVSNTIFKNAYTWLCTSLSLSSYVKYFNDQASNTIFTFFKTSGTVNNSSNDVCFTVQQNPNALVSGLSSQGSFNLYSKIFSFKSVSGLSWINMYNTFGNNIQMAFKANESAENVYPDFLLTVKNLNVGNLLNGGVACFSTYINLASFAISQAADYITNELSYVQIFNGGQNTNTNITGINFKSDSTNLQNQTDSSIICKPTDRSRLQPLNNGFGQLGLYSDRVEIGTVLAPYNIAGATNIILGSANSTTTIYGRINLQGEFDFTPPSNGDTFNPVFVQSVRQRLNNP